jgi:hypothetical protein
MSTVPQYKGQKKPTHLSSTHCNKAYKFGTHTSGIQESLTNSAKSIGLGFRIENPGLVVHAKCFKHPSFFKNKP